MGSVHAWLPASGPPAAARERPGGGPVACAWTGLAPGEGLGPLVAPLPLWSRAAWSGPNIWMTYTFRRSDLAWQPTSRPFLTTVGQGRGQDGSMRAYVMERAARPVVCCGTLGSSDDEPAGTALEPHGRPRLCP